MTDPLPLDGVLVTDFSRVLAGPPADGVEGVRAADLGRALRQDLRLRWRELLIKTPRCTVRFLTRRGPALMTGWAR